MTLFTELGLAETLTRALADERYEKPTPIQAAAIPPSLEGRDVIGIAQTGTGKTAAFALPILHRLALAPEKTLPKAPRVVVLCPTRELGAQIVDSFHAYGRYLRLKTMLAIGGVPINKQIRALAAGLDILVATPGRLLDLAGERAVTFERVSVLVLDEADRMLDMGFIRDIRKIVAMIPKERQTLFFSATMPQEIADLAKQMLRDPVTVAVTPVSTTVELIEQRAIRADRAAKPALLTKLLTSEPVERALIFTRTKHGADRVVRGLNRDGISAEAIHGNKTQGNRERTMAAFRSGKITTLVATDIAARGIDVDGVSHVINFDLPNIPETYVHRIGRTARAGASGVAISLVAADEMEYLRDIEKLIRRQVPLSGDAHRDTSSKPPQRGRGNRQHHEPREDREQHHGQRQERDARHGKGGQRQRSKGKGQGGKPQHQRPTGPSRQHNGNVIGDVGFMARKPRGGMGQGSAY
ncbi:MAG TPA: DEAD/DEAH box helicase [Bauldia sp.]|nr:DEAD/DEAH box helicase [Bauldia sp.]